MKSALVPDHIFARAYTNFGAALNHISTMPVSSSIAVVFLGIVLGIFSTPHLCAATHDDAESLVPEFYITIRGDGSGIPSMTVTFDAYDEYPGGVKTTYSETTTITGSSAGTDWVTPYKSLLINKGMPLDVAGTLHLSGSHVAEYKIFINTPDPKYQPCVDTVERYLIQKFVDTGANAFPHTSYVFFKRAGDAGGPAGKVSSAMAGWRNFKMSLGYGKTGKPLGYVTFINGSEARLSDTSGEVSTASYTSGTVPHTQLYTPQANYDLFWDDTYTESGYMGGAYKIKNFDNALQPGTPTSDGNGNAYLTYGSSTPFCDFVLNYASPSGNNPIVTKAKLKRFEGNSIMSSEAFRAVDSSAGQISTSIIFHHYLCGFGGTYGATPVYCDTYEYRPYWLIYPNGTIKDFAYDWIDDGTTGDRNCRFMTENYVFNPDTGNPSSRSRILGVGLGASGAFTTSRIDSGRYESSLTFGLLGTGYFWKDSALRHDSTTSSGGVLTGNAKYYWAENTGKHLKLEYQIEPGGGWTYYEYYDDFDQRGMVSRITKPYCDSPNTPAANANGALATEFTYAANWDGSKTLPAEIITKLKGSTAASDKVISRTTYDYATETYGGLGVWVTTKKDYSGPGAGDYTTTVSKRFRPDTQQAMANLPLSETKADGTKTVWNYESGTYNEVTKAFAVFPDANPLAALLDTDSVNMDVLVVSGSGISGADGLYYFAGDDTINVLSSDRPYWKAVNGLFVVHLEGMEGGYWALLDSNHSQLGIWQYHQSIVKYGTPKDGGIREWKISCFPSIASGAIQLGVDDSYVVPGRSTAEMRTRDKFGRLRRVDTLVCSGGGDNAATWHLLTSETQDYDIGGNLIKTSKLMDGEIPQAWVTVYEAQYTDVNGASEAYGDISFNNAASSSIHYTGRKQYEKDRTGVIRKFYYDEYARVKRVVTLQPPDNLAGIITPSTVPPATQTAFTYDADNRILSTTIRTPGTTADNGALVSQTTFNLAGLPTIETAPGGYQAITDYSQIGSRLVKKTLKGLNGNTALDRYIISTKYVDGRSKAVYTEGALAGAAVIPEYHTYSIEDAGAVTINSVSMRAGTSRAISSSGQYNAHTARKSTTDYDWLGRVATDTSANPSGVGDLITSSSYNNKGQLISTTTGGLAPVLYKYNDFGQLSRSGIRLGASGDLNLASMDRISDQDTFFSRDSDGTWWEAAVNTTYPIDGSDTPLVIKQTLAQRSNWKRQTVTALGQDFANAIPDARTLVVDTSGIYRTNLTYIARGFALVYNRDALGLCGEVDGNPKCRSYSESISVNGQGIYTYTADSDTVAFAWYDDYGRGIQTRNLRLDQLNSVTVARDAICQYRQGSTEVTWQRTADNIWTLNSYDDAGRVSVVKNYTDALSGTTPPAAAAPAKATRYEYNLRGQVTKVWGDMPHPMQSVYFEDGSALGGQLYEQLTYNGGTGWSGTSWPTSPGTPNRIRFDYWPETGLLKTKKYDTTGTGTSFQSVNYTYNKRRDLLTRVWQRGTSPGNTTTYNYRESAGANTGELLSVDYGDSNETDLSYTYKRSGALASVVDAAGTRSFTYRASDQQLDYQDLPTATYGTGLKLGLTYDGVGRISGYWFGANQGSAQVSASYAYWDFGVTGWDDRSGRLGGVSSTLGNFTYKYIPGSSLISDVYGPIIGGQEFLQTRYYTTDSDLLTDSFAYTAIPDPFQVTALLAVYSYRHDSLHRVTKLSQTGQIYQDDSYNTGLTLGMAYNDRNELLGVTNYLTDSPESISGSTVLPRRTFAFNYDTIGNRTAIRVDTDPLLRYDTPTAPNVLGQYVQRQNPSTLDINGLVGKPTTISLSVNGGGAISPSRLSLGSVAPDYFYATPARTTPTTTKNESVDLTKANPTSTETRRILARASTENFGYDTDGNLTSDAAWTYTYDSENRVKTVETLASLLTTFGTSSWKLKFTYDFLGRRVKKEVYNYTGSAWPSTPNDVYTYLYDGMTMIAEFTGTTPTLSKSYYWGLDLSGSIQGAGGVGGLLGMKIHTGNKRYAAINDCGGNVVGMMDLDNGVLAAEYEYSPFGEPLRASLAVANANPWRFSTKYFDAETGLLNFGYRYYSPTLGRFLNRDPKDELGRLQLSAPLGGGGAVAWSYIGALVGEPGKSPALTPQTPTGLAQSNESQSGGYRNSTQPGNVLATRKGSGSSGGGPISRPSRAPASAGGSHLYGFVNNNPYGAIDPLGLQDFSAGYTPWWRFADEPWPDYSNTRTSDWGKDADFYQGMYSEGWSFMDSEWRDAWSTAIGFAASPEWWINFGADAVWGQLESVANTFQYPAESLFGKPHETSGWRFGFDAFSTVTLFAPLFSFESSIIKTESSVGRFLGGDILATSRGIPNTGIEFFDRLAIKTPEFQTFLSDVGSSGWRIRASTLLEDDIAFFRPRNRTFYYNPNTMIHIDTLHEYIHFGQFKNAGNLRTAGGLLHEYESAAYGFEFHLGLEHGFSGEYMLHLANRLKGL